MWRRPESADRCPLYLARGPLSGVEVTDSTGTVTFITSDGSNLRLVRGPASSRCGALVHPTDFSDLFLTKELHHEPFNRPLHESEVSIATYSNVKDSFLYDTVHKDRIKALTALREQQCRADRNEKASRYALQAAEQGAVIDGETAGLGKGQFITAAGEAWYQYRCRPITDTARLPQGKCYSALPVTMREEDYLHYVRARVEGGQSRYPASEPPKDCAGAGEDSPEGADGGEIPGNHNRHLPARDAFFLEPRTHRLLTTGLEEPCAPPLLPLYKNLHGRWVSYSSDALRIAADPLATNGEAFDLDQIVQRKKDIDWENGGIYTWEVIEGFEASPRFFGVVPLPRKLGVQTGVNLNKKC